MTYIEYRGNLFASKAQTLVNTVNCVGVMGKGVALEFRRRFPQMFAHYRQVCAEGDLRPGQILSYCDSNPWVLNFAVKKHWRHPSKLAWVESCLQLFVEQYRELGVRSVALPWLGAMNGQLDWSVVHELIRNYLASLNDLDVELVEFDPDAPDPLFERVRDARDRLPLAVFAAQAGISERAARVVYQALETERITSLARLSEVRRLGNTALDRIYSHFSTDRQLTPDRVVQPRLFDTAAP